MGLLTSPVGNLILRPWYDHAALHLLAKAYFPLGRAWAASEIAGRDADTFIQETGGDERPLGLIRRALGTTAEARERAQKAEADWLSAMFGGTGSETLAGVEERRELEARRVKTSFRYMACRASFAALHFLRAFPKARIDIATPTEANQVHGGRLGKPDAFLPLTSPDEFEVSQSVNTETATISWIRGPQRNAQTDRAWARVSVPPGQEKNPVLILSHGIAMEDDVWGKGRMTAAVALSSGLTLIQPEGPGHGRRRPKGRYGGETVLGRGPVGLMDYFQDHIRELGALVRWARTRFDAPVAIGGISLGALSAQLAATAANAWPDDARPDGLFLVTPSPDLRAVAFQGKLTEALNLVTPLRHAGWSDEALQKWLPLLEPQGTPPIDPAKMVFVLGSVDTVTPYATGAALAARWKAPPENVFTRPNGHFTTSIDLLRDQAPLRQLAQQMAD